MTYSYDFRRHVLNIREIECLTLEETADRFGVGIASLVRWANNPHPKETREGRPRKIDLEALAQDVRDNPDSYQYERAAKFGVHQKSIWAALRKIGVTYKKNPDASKSQRRYTTGLPTDNQSA